MSSAICAPVLASIVTLMHQLCSFSEQLSPEYPNITESCSDSISLISLYITSLQELNSTCKMYFQGESVSCHSKSAHKITLVSPKKSLLLGTLNAHKKKPKNFLDNSVEILIL